MNTDNLKRDTFKIIEVKGRTFKITRLNALKGSYLLFTLLMKFLPLSLEQQAGISGLPSDRTAMTKEEFSEFQKDCLSCVSESLKAGYASVLNENGTWGIQNIEDDTFLVALLTVNALMFNVGDFFEEENKAALALAIQDLPFVLAPM